MRLALLHPIKWVSLWIFHLQEPVREHAHLYLLAITFCIPFTLKSVNFLMEMKKPAQSLLAQQLQITKNAKDLHQQLLGQQLPQHRQSQPLPHQLCRLTCPSSRGSAPPPRFVPSTTASWGRITARSLVSTRSWISATCSCAPASTTGISTTPSTPDFFT